MAFLVFFLPLFSSCVIQKIDYSPPQSQSYYQKTHQILDTSNWYGTPNSEILVGWAKVNITPEKPVALAGYGKRLGKKYEQVLDSVYIRAIVFKTDSVKAAIISADLLIIPMEVAAVLSNYLPVGYTLQNTFLTATHTHHSIGNWAKKPAGWIMAGRFRKKTVHHLAKQIADAIQRAEKQMQTAELGYASIPTCGLVKNRMTSEGIVDSSLRVLKIMKADSSIGVLTSFAAHPTNLKAKDLALSADYPGELVRILEQLPKVDFAAFSAGAVGSQNCALNKAGREKATLTGKALAAKIQKELNLIETNSLIQIKTIHLLVLLPEPHWRIGEKRFAPGIFHLFFGKYPAFLSGLALNNVLLLNTPSDYSAEFIPELEKQSQKLNLNLILSSFNGAYIGYVVPERQYSLKRYESRDMNFYGPYAGNYLQELLKQLIIKYKNEN